MDGAITYAGLALDFELFVRRVLPARPEHGMQMTVLPLQERACVLRQAIPVLQPHLLAGRLLQGDKTSCCQSLIPLGGCACLGLTKRPYFVSRELMVRQLEHLAAHCTTIWQQRPHRQLAAAPMQDFQGDFYPLWRSRAPAIPACPGAPPVCLVAVPTVPTEDGAPWQAEGAPLGRRGLGKSEALRGASACCMDIVNVLEDKNG